MYKQDLALQMGGKLRYLQFTISFADLALTSGAGAKFINFTDGSNNAKLVPLPIGSKVLGIEVKTSVAFSGGALTAMTVSVGTSANVARFTPAFDIFQAVSDTTLQETSMFKSGQGRTSQQWGANFTPTTDTCANCTAGSVDIRICYLDVTTTPLPA